MAASDIATQIGQLVGIPVGVGGSGLFLYLWLGGKVRLASDADKAVQTVQIRLDAVIADRDAWRTAHSEEVRARQAAEQAAAALMGSASMSAQLLEALKMELQRPRNGHGSGT